MTIYFFLFEYIDGTRSKYEVKDQESIQSSTTPDPEHHMGKWKKHTRKNHIQESQEVILFPAGDYKAAMNRLKRIAHT